MKYLFLLLAFTSIQLKAQLFKSFYYYEDIYSNGNWVEVIKSESSWNAGVRTATDFNYSLINASWVKDVKNRTRIVYNASNNITEYTIDILKSGNYVPYQQSIYSYTSFGKVQDIIITTLDTINNVMKNSYKYIYKYDLTNRRTVYQLYTWDATKSIYSNPTGDSIAYNGANAYEIFEWSWDAVNNKYKTPSFKNIILTDNNGNILKQTYYTNFTGTWTKASNTTYTLNSNFDIQNSVDSTFLTGNQVTRRQTYTYNASNKLIETIRQQYIGGNFVDEFKQTRSYNVSNDEVERINSNYSNGMWNFARRYRWVFGAIGIHTDNPYTDLKVYSSENRIYFNNSSNKTIQFSVFDIAGKHLLSGTVQKQNEILETNLSTGFYYISYEGTIRKLFIESTK